MALTGHLYRYIVRPIAVGGMLVGACFTLWKMRKNLILGIKRGIADVRKSAGQSAVTNRTEQDLSFKVVILGVVDHLRADDRTLLLLHEHVRSARSSPRW